MTAYGAATATTAAYDVIRDAATPGERDKACQSDGAGGTGRCSASFSSHWSRSTFACTRRRPRHAWAISELMAANMR